jgi:DNA-binding NarL/FixJ family response regulator
MTIKHSSTALIVASPGPLRDGLQALMMAMPQMGVVDEAGDLSSALKISLNHHPDLILLDSGLADADIWMAVRQTKARWPKARCVFLADDVRQQQQAEAAGADAAILKGFPAAKLMLIIVKLLSQQIRLEEDDNVVVTVPGPRPGLKAFGVRIAGKVVT